MFHIFFIFYFFYIFIFNLLLENVLEFIKLKIGYAQYYNIIILENIKILNFQVFSSNNDKHQV